MTESALPQPANTLKRPSIGPSVSSRVCRIKLAKTTDNSTVTATPLSGHAESFTLFNDRPTQPQTAARTAPTNQPPKLQEPPASLANANVPAELSKLSTRDANLLRKIGWRKLVTGRRQRRFRRHEEAATSSQAPIATLPKQWCTGNVPKSPVEPRTIGCRNEEGPS